MVLSLREREGSRKGMSQDASEAPAWHGGRRYRATTVSCHELSSQQHCLPGTELGQGWAPVCARDSSTCVEGTVGPELSGLHGVECTLVPNSPAHRGARLHKQAMGQPPILDQSTP